MAWTHAITPATPLQPDEAECRRCHRAFLPFGARSTYCSPECSAQPVVTERGRAKKREADRVRGSTAARGYGPEHQRRRAALLPAAIGTLCPICGRVMTDYQMLDADHVQPIGAGGQTDGPLRIVHARCNRSRGDGTRRPRRKRQAESDWQVW